MYTPLTPVVVGTDTVRGYDVYILLLNGMYGYQIQQNNEIIVFPEFTYHNSADAHSAGCTAIDAMYKEVEDSMDLVVHLEDYPVLESYEQLRDLFNQGRYEVPLHIRQYVWPSQYGLPAIPGDEHKRRKKYAVDATGVLLTVFKRDLYNILGITNHPKAEKLFSLAWERGHGNGYLYVFQEAEDLADLLMP